MPIQNRHATDSREHGKRGVSEPWPALGLKIAGKGRRSGFESACHNFVTQK